MEKELGQRKWRLSDIGVWLREAGKALIEGKLLQRLRIDKYFIHIVFTFFLLWLSIWISIQTEKSLVKVEDNRKRIENLEIARAQKTIELVSLGSMGKVEKALKEKGSSVGFPSKPAGRIKVK